MSSRREPIRILRMRTTGRPSCPQARRHDAGTKSGAVPRNWSLLLTEAHLRAGRKFTVSLPIPVWRELAESHEAVGFGTIFWHEDQPKVHFHGSYAKGDAVKSGCLREGSEIFLVLEVVITEILDVKAVRELDEDSGMVLLKMPG